MRCVGKNITSFINNLIVNYNDEGSDEDPTIILIHGFPLNKSMWDVQMEALHDYYRVIAYDIRGHGESEAGDEDFSIDLFTDDLLALMDHLEIKHAVLCGLSMGGYIALNAIENYPERFDALILSDTQCISDSVETKEKRMQAIAAIREKGVENYADESIKKLFADESYSTRDSEIAAVREMIINTTSSSLCNTLLALLKRKDALSILPIIQVPVLVMVGSEDKITPPATSILMHHKIQNSFFKMIQHAGHLSNMENPYEFNYTMKNFMSHVGQKPAVPITSFNN